MDVPVSAKQLVDKAIRSPQSVVVNQSLRVEKTIFIKGFDGHTTTHRVSEDTMIGENLGERTDEMDVMISFNGKMVGMHDIMKDIWIGHECTLRCTRRLQGGAQRFRQQQPGIPDSGRARHVDKNGCGRSEIVASGVGARRTMIRLHLQLLPTLLVPPVDLPRGQAL